MHVKWEHAPPVSIRSWKREQQPCSPTTRSTSHLWGAWSIGSRSDARLAMETGRSFPWVNGMDDSRPREISALSRTVQRVEMLPGPWREEKLASIYERL